MEIKNQSDFDIWKITLPIVLGITGLVFIASLFVPQSNYQVGSYSNNQIVTTNSSNLAKTLPSNSSKPITQPKSKNKTEFAPKPSNQSVALATFIFLNSGSQKDEMIRKFANDENDLSLAVNNLALILDKDPKLYTMVLTTVLDYSIKQGARNSGSTTVEDLEYKIDELNDKIDDLNDSFGY